MSFLHSLLSLPREGLVIAACVMISLLVVCLFALFSRRRYVTIKQSEEIELIAFHIRCIADALERLSVARETQPPVDSSASKHAGMSTIGR
jgi:uncharacterized membrane-anchored protein